MSIGSELEESQFALSLHQPSPMPSVVVGRKRHWPCSLGAPPPRPYFDFDLTTPLQSVASRALMRGVDGGQVPITELTIGQALNSARDQFIKSMGNQRDGY